MMPLALVMVWIELRLMSWLIVEVEEVDPTMLIRRSKKPSADPGFPGA